MEDIVSRTLNSYVLGEHIGSIWGIGRVLRWTPTVSASKLRPDEDQKELLKSVGLYKVQGDTVAAVLGGIYQQFVRSLFIFHLWPSRPQRKHCLMENDYTTGCLSGSSRIPHAPSSSCLTAWQSGRTTRCFSCRCGSYV